MKTWAERPTELAYLLNPAFCGWLLREAVQGYTSVKPAGMPLPLAFLILPVVLHQATQSQVPAAVTTKLHVWLQGHPEVRINFADRTKELTPFTREGLLFLVSRGQIQVDDDGAVTVVGRLGPDKTGLLDNSEEMKESLSRAKFVGRWFATAGEPATVFQNWGVCP
jgi:Family of unknown function (DUF6521)